MLLIPSIFVLQETELANIVHPSHEKTSILKTKPELLLYNFVSLRVIYTICSRELSFHNTKSVGILWHCSPLLGGRRETPTAVTWRQDHTVSSESQDCDTYEPPAVHYFLIPSCKIRTIH